MKPTTELLIGSPLEGEEAQFLVRLCSDFDDSCLILANFEVVTRTSSRQIDFLIVSDTNRGLIELKCLRGPVFGSENGGWTLRDFAKNVVPYPGENPWNQAVQAKFAVSDEMSAFCKLHTEIPLALDTHFYKEFDATVCIFPGMHPDSKVTKGNYKAWVRGYSEFLSNFRTRRLSGSWSRAEWRRFAIEHLSLRPVGLQLAIDSRALAAFDQVAAYCSTLARPLEGNPPISTWPEGQKYGAALVQELLNPEHTVLMGPSGCGKSCHVLGAVAKALDSSEVPILVKPRRYRGGDFWSLIQQGVAPFCRGSAKDLLAAIATCGRHPLLVVDGLNECPDGFMSELHAGIQAFLRHYNARLLTSCQYIAEAPVDVTGNRIEMSSLTQEQKRAIYENYAKFPGDDDVLGSLSNAYDLSIAGKCHATGPAALPRASLYDRYCRAQVPAKSQTPFLALLRQLAAEMDKTLSIAISRDEFERLIEKFAEAESLPLNFIDETRELRLLDVDDDAVSFEHELLFHYFRCEYLRRRCKDIEELARELQRPKNQGLQEFVLSRVSSAADIASILVTCKDVELLKKALAGLCGPDVSAFMSRLADEVFDEAVRDLANIRLRIESIERDNGKRIVSSAFVEGNREWNATELLLFDATLQSVTNEGWRSRWLALYDVTETSLRAAASETAAGTKFKFSGVWRETVRCLGHLPGSGNVLPGLKLLAAVDALGPKGESRHVVEAITEQMSKNVKADPRREFSLLLLLAGSRTLCHLGHPPSVDQCIELLRTSCEHSTYLTRIDSIDMFRWIHASVETHFPDRRADIRDALEAVDKGDPFVNTSLLEVLAAYELLEPPVSTEQALHEFRAVVKPDAKLNGEFAQLADLYPEMDSQQFRREKAYSSIGKIFEGVFGSAYWEAYQMLDSSEKSALLSLAACAEKGAFHTEWILSELIGLGDPAYLEVFQRNATGIERGNPFINEAVSTFVLSVIGCARLGDSCPQMRSGGSLDEQAWVAIGEILFWHERRSTEPNESDRHIRALWARAQGSVAAAIPDVILHLERRYFCETLGQDIRLVDAYPSEIREVFKEALARRNEISSLWLNPGLVCEESLRYAISVLSTVGDATCAEVLAAFIDDPTFGEEAVRAVRQLRSK